MTRQPYRILRLSLSDELIEAPLTYLTQQDETAVRYAEYLRDTDIGVEVWQAARLVARLQPFQTFTKHI